MQAPVLEQFQLIRGKAELDELPGLVEAGAGGRVEGELRVQMFGERASIEFCDESRFRPRRVLRGEVFDENFAEVVRTRAFEAFVDHRSLVLDGQVGDERVDQFVRFHLVALPPIRKPIDRVVLNAVQTFFCPMRVDVQRSMIKMEAATGLPDVRCDLFWR